LNGRDLGKACGRVTALTSFACRRFDEARRFFYGAGQVIGIITNPNALGLVRDKQLARRLVGIVGSDGIVVETRTPDELRAAVRDFHRRGADIVCTCGGDGTNLSTVTEIVRTWRGPAPGAGSGRNGTPPSPRRSLGGADFFPPVGGGGMAGAALGAAGLGSQGTAAATTQWLAMTPNALGAAAADTRPLPQFGILRGGTVNTVAENLHLKGHPEEILGRLVEHYRKRRPIPHQKVDLLEVNGMCGFLFGAAMPGRFFEAYYGGPTTGAAWAAVLATRTLVSGITRGRFARWLFEPVYAELTVDGKVLDTHHFTLLVAATLRSVGFGVKVTYRAGTAAGRFHLVASSLPAGRLVTQARRVFLGQPLRGQPHADVLAARATVRFASPQTYTLDGDLFRADRIELACGPRLTILTP
jgi:diacylglycerol kinase family enzyme